MENALLVGLSRQMALTHELDVIANNIANIDTTGYKADNEVFSEFLMPGASDRTSAAAIGASVRAGPRDLDRHSPGAIQHTGDPLNVAIEGNTLFWWCRRRGAATLHAQRRALDKCGRPAGHRRQAIR